MSTRELGRSGPTISPIRFGGNVFGWIVDAASLDANAVQLLNEASAA